MSHEDLYENKLDWLNEQQPLWMPQTFYRLGHQGLGYRAVEVVQPPGPHCPKICQFVCFLYDSCCVSIIKLYYSGENIKIVHFVAQSIALSVSASHWLFVHSSIDLWTPQLGWEPLNMHLLPFLPKTRRGGLQRCKMNNFKFICRLNRQIQKVAHFLKSFKLLCYVAYNPTQPNITWGLGKA